MAGRRPGSHHRRGRRGTRPRGPTRRRTARTHSCRSRRGGARVVLVSSKGRRRRRSCRRAGFALAIVATGLAAIVAAGVAAAIPAAVVAGTVAAVVVAACVGAAGLRRRRRWWCRRSRRYRPGRQCFGGVFSLSVQPWRAMTTTRADGRRETRCSGDDMGSPGKRRHGSPIQVRAQEGIQSRIWPLAVFSSPSPRAWVGKNGHPWWCVVRCPATRDNRGTWRRPPWQTCGSSRHAAAAGAGVMAIIAARRGRTRKRPPSRKSTKSHC